MDESNIIELTRLAAPIRSQLAERLNALLHEALEISPNHKLPQLNQWTLLKSGAILLGSVTGIPSIKIAKKLAGNNAILKFLYPYSMFASVGALSIWSLLDFIQLQKIRLQPKDNESWLKMLIRPGIVGLLAILTTAPYVIVSYKYNDDSMAIAALSFACEAAINISPFNRNYRAFANLLSAKSKNDLAVVHLKELILKRLSAGIDVFATLPEQEQEQFFAKYLSDPGTGEAHCHNQMLTALIKLGSKKNDLTKNGLINTSVMQPFIYASSFIFPAAWAFIIIKFMAETVGHQLNNTLGGILIALMTCLPPYMLEGILTRMLNFKLLDNINDIYSNTFTPNISQRFYPMIYTLLTLVSLLTVSCSFATRTQIALDEINGFMKYIILPIIIISTVLYKASAMLSLVPKVIETGAAYFGHPPIKQLTNFTAKLKEFTLIIEDSSVIQFAEFYSELQEELTTACSDDVEIHTAQQAHKKTSPNRYSFWSSESFNRQSEQITASSRSEIELVNQLNHL